MKPSSVIDANGDEHMLDGGLPVAEGDAIVLATSGASGEPKGVILTHDAVRASALATSARLGVTGNDHWLACLPLSHIGGLAVIARALCTGNKLTVLPRFDVLDVESSGATLVSLVATALARIDPSRFRTIVLGGAAPPSDLPANVIVTYGMTESGSGVVYDGVPLDGVEVRIEAGEIHLRGPMLLRAYRDGRCPLVDGWFATGDDGEWLDDGRLRVVGRRSDLIISGGENVRPEPVEQAIRANLLVADVAVTGTPDAEWGEVVTAYVVTSGPTAPTLDDLRRSVNAVLPSFHAPRLMYVVDAIPRTSLGKPRRTELRPPS